MDDRPSWLTVAAIVFLLIAAFCFGLAASGYLTPGCGAGSGISVT